MGNDFQSGPRSGYRAKRKKTNLILNGLIVIVLLLIAFVAFTIFASGNDKDKAAPKKAVQKTETNQSLDKNKDAQKDQEVTTTDNGDSNASDNNQQNDETVAGDSSTQENTDESQTVTTDGNSSSDIQKTVDNPDGKQADTSQSGAHTPDYDSNSTDWKEMLNAISGATGLDQSNMTVWFLGSDKSTSNGSVGTVSSKDKKQKYRVYIHWVDGEGWKPTKVEDLSGTDKEN